MGRGRQVHALRRQARGGARIRSGHSFSVTHPRPTSQLRWAFKLGPAASLHVTSGTFRPPRLHPRSQVPVAPCRLHGQPGRRRNVSRTASSANYRWFGLTPSQFFWAVAIRVMVAAIVGAVVYLATGSLLWLIVALLATSGVIRRVAQPEQRAKEAHP